MDEVILLAERIREEVQGMTFQLPENGDSIKLTISAGLYEPEEKTKLAFKELITETEKYLNDAISAGGNRIVSHATENILELLEKLKENKPEELLPKIDSILHHITPLLKFLANNAKDKLQAALRKISNK